MCFVSALACTLNTSLYRREVDEPILRYQVSTTSPGESYVPYQVSHGSQKVFNLFYVGGEVSGDIYFNRSSLASTSNVSIGIIHLKLAPLEIGDEGPYILISGQNQLDCKLVYILGKDKYIFLKSSSITDIFKS